MVNSLGKTLASSLSYSALIVTNVAVGGTVLSLISLTLIKNFEDTPEIIAFGCALGIEREECPKYAEDLHAADEERREALQAKKDAEAAVREAHSKLDELSNVEGRFESTTFFTHHDDPHSDFSVTVGTSYSSLLNPSDTPDYFCYIRLSPDKEGAARNLFVRDSGRRVNVSRSMRRAYGVSSKTLEFANSVCSPMLFKETT